MSIITIQDVKIETITTGKKPYNKATAVYTNDRGENKNKTVMSFSNPAVFAFLSKIKGPTPVKVEYDDTQYRNWTKIEPAAQEVAAKAAPGAPRSTTYVDNRETSEERARRQVMIVKQSSLTNALKYFEIMGDKPESVNQVTDIAQFFVDWVMDDNLQEVETLGRDGQALSED